METRLKQLNQLFALLPESALVEADFRQLPWLRFSNPLENVFLRYYDLRFRYWIRAAAVLVGVFYIFRTISVNIAGPNRINAEALHWYTGFLILVVCLAFTAAALTFTNAPLEQIQWIGAPAFMAIAFAVGLITRQQLALGHTGIFTIFLYQAMLSIPLGFRFRFRPGLPLLTLVTAVMLFNLHFGTGKLTVTTVYPVVSSLLFALTMGYLLEYDTRRDFLNQLALHRAEAAVRQLATIDALSGALNRRSFFERANEVIAQAKRNGRPLSILVIDLDEFKKINDSFGHAAGDRVIERFAALCREVIGDSELFGRLGGEEFAILLPGFDRSDAADLAERLRVQAAASELTANGRSVRYTISVGVAELQSNDTNVDTMMIRADRKLYEAKDAGRNRVFVDDRDA
jgi:diguanylate cyclase (GGDEF)-like protein